MRLREKLREKLQQELSVEELALLPRGFQTIGTNIIIRLNEEMLNKKTLIANAYLELLPKIKGVYLNSGRIEGRFREPENIQFITGEDNPEVIHREHGVIYKFDITKVMYSKGNINERKYLAQLVKNQEVIVDMFAGIGYFSLPIAKNAHPTKIYSIELNPVSYHYLVENVKLNNLEDIIVPIQGNCKEKVVELYNSGVRADRVIMGIFPAPKDYIPEALLLLKDSGTIYHYEGVALNKEVHLLFEDFAEIAERKNLSCLLIEQRVVKSYGPHLFHIVNDIFVKKK
ncbi:MAG: class I SAM-dependent methyltransferase family protein [Candidatus Lokiarchaeota archaeon]